MTHNSKSFILFGFLLFLGLTIYIEDITTEQLEDIKTSSKVWLVYSANEVSTEHQSILDDVAETLNGFYRVGVLQAEGQPNLKLYADDGETFDFSSDFTIDNIVEFALTSTDGIIESRSRVALDMKANFEFNEKEKERANKEWEDEQALRVKTNTLLLNAETWQTNFLKTREAYFVNFYEANCSVCIELNKEWQDVSKDLKGKARVAKLNITEPGNEILEQSIKLSDYPSIRFYPAGNKNVDEFSEFTGIRKKFSILEWANAKLSEVKDTVDIPELNKQNYETLCKTSKSTCVILFVDNPSEVSDKVGELAAKYLKKPISFLISKKGSQPAFEGQVGVESAPETIMMYCKMKKFLKMGSMDFKNIDETINEITLGNRNGFNKYKFVEEVA